MKKVIKNLLNIIIIVVIINEALIPYTIKKIKYNIDRLINNESSQYSPNFKKTWNDILIKYGIKEKEENQNFRFIVSDTEEMDGYEVIVSNDDEFEYIESEDIEDTFEYIESEDIKEKVLIKRKYR